SAYKYSNARWSQRTREFLGFESLEVTEGSTVTATTYGQQTDACALRATAVVVRNPTEVFWADTFKYLDNSTQAPNAPWICEVQSRQHEDCEGRTACRTSNAETRSYDTFGNLIEVVGEGDPSTNTDDRITRTAYFPNIPAYLVSYPAQVELFDSARA